MLPMLKLLKIFLENRFFQFLILVGFVYFNLFFLLFLTGSENNYANSNKLYEKYFQRNLNSEPRMGVLMITCNRTRLIESTLRQLIKARAETRVRFLGRFLNKSITDLIYRMPIAVSQDCYSWEVTEMLENFLKADKIQNIFKFPDWDKKFEFLRPSQRKNLLGYYKISAHYRWAIQKMFDTYRSLDKLILVEDDLNFSPDFFEYFITLSGLLDRDETLYCVSGWNDNGKSNLIKETSDGLALHRTDFFPGLGWMLKKSIWEEIKPEWPLAFWDDWFRHWEQRKGRQCIRPEISRVSTSGRKGVSQGQFYEQHLRFINHFTHYTPFFDYKDEILQFLEFRHYDQWLLNEVYNSSREISALAMFKKDFRDSFGTAGPSPQPPSYRITYYTRNEFLKCTQLFGLMSDFKWGVSRTAYKGIITFWYSELKVFLAPPSTRKIYIIEWA